MIELIFYFGTDIILITIRGNHVSFRTSVYNGAEATIEGLRLDYTGVIKEFPDLKDNPLWKEKAIKRFKEKIRGMATEEEVADYLIADLRKVGYIPRWKQKAGFRREAL